MATGSSGVMSMLAVPTSNTPANVLDENANRLSKTPMTVNVRLHMTYTPFSPSINTPFDVPLGTLRKTILEPPANVRVQSNATAVL